MGLVRSVRAVRRTNPNERVFRKSQSLRSADTPQSLQQLEQNLKAEARRADLLMIWTDCDREGEHIGYEVVEVCRQVNPRLRVRRARFSALIDR